MSKKKIRITKGGPYEVTGSVPLFRADLIPYADEPEASESWKKVEQYDTGDRPSLLCRCGHSGNKPFCDSSHYAEGFVGKEVADRTPYAEVCKVYEGEAFDLMDRTRLCAIARFCDVGGGVWQLTFNSNDPENAEMAKKMASSCPSGRLTIRTKDGEQLEQELEQEIFASEDIMEGYAGPLYVQGGITLESTDGTTYEVRNRRTLCRCGESNNIPFCDSSHLRCEHMKLEEK